MCVSIKRSRTNRFTKRQYTFRNSNVPEENHPVRLYVTKHYNMYVSYINIRVSSLSSSSEIGDVVQRNISTFKF